MTEEMALPEWTGVIILQNISVAMEEAADDRVGEWLLMSSPLPIAAICVAYLGLVLLGPRFMEHRKPFDLKYHIAVYNIGLVFLSAYMFYEFVMSAYLSGYSLVCQPVDYTNNPLALRMASVCWIYYFSKVIEIMDTVFFILRKKESQVTFLHVYHHSTMLINWYLGVKYIAGGQSFFLAMLNCLVHVCMYAYYGLSSLGPHMQPYLWWKKYITRLQLLQFVAVMVHTSVNLAVDCDFPRGFNYAVFLYTISLILLFSNFYRKSYHIPQQHQHDPDQLTAMAYTNGHDKKHL